LSTRPWEKKRLQKKKGSYNEHSKDNTTGKLTKDNSYKRKPQKSKEKYFNEEEEKKVFLKSEEKRSLSTLSPLPEIEDQNDGEDNTYRIKKKVKGEANNAGSPENNHLKGNKTELVPSKLYINFSHNDLAKSSSAESDSSNKQSYGFFLNKLLEG